jgi:hypothetical protein
MRYHGTDDRLKLVDAWVKFVREPVPLVAP